MPKKSDFWETSETGNWNVASDFTKLKIMKNLYEADEYELIATFGTSSILEDLLVDENAKSIAKLKAIKRLLKTLQLLINNTKFAVKKSDKEKMAKFLETLDKIEKTYPHLQTISYDQRQKKQTVKINEELFDKVLKHLIQIKSDVNDPLNKADLIFTFTEEFDAKAAKEQIKEGLRSLG